MNSVSSTHPPVLVEEYFMACLLFVAITSLCLEKLRAKPHVDCGYVFVFLLWLFVSVLILSLTAVMGIQQYSHDYATPA